MLNIAELKTLNANIAKLYERCQDVEVPRGSTGSHCRVQP